MRAPFQILILPYRIVDNNILYGLFLRKKQNIWQFISGGGENRESPIETAVRELREETCINAKKGEFIILDSQSTIPVVNITGEYTWGKDIFVVPEYTFAINVTNLNINISSEHKEFIWLEYEDSINKLTFDSNKTALWELNERLKRLKNRK